MLQNFDIVENQMNENMTSIKEITSSTFTTWSEQIFTHFSLNPSQKNSAMCTWSWPKLNN